MKKESMFKLFSCDFLKPVGRLVFMAHGDPPELQNSSAETEVSLPPEGLEDLGQSVDSDATRYASRGTKALEKVSGVMMTAQRVEALARAVVSGLAVSDVYSTFAQEMIVKVAGSQTSGRREETLKEMKGILVKALDGATGKSKERIELAIKKLENPDKTLIDAREEAKKAQLQQKVEGERAFVDAEYSSAEQAAKTLRSTQVYLDGFDRSNPEVKKLVDVAIGKINTIETTNDSVQDKANDRTEVLYNLMAKAEALTEREKKIPKDLALLELAAAKKAFDRGVEGSDVRLERAQQAVDKITEEEAMDQPFTPKKAPEKKELSPDQKYARTKQMLDAGKVNGVTLFGLTQLLVRMDLLKETDHKPASFVTAVEKMQRRVGANPDGIFGPQTLKKIESRFAPQDIALLKKDVDSLAPASEKPEIVREIADPSRIFVIGNSRRISGSKVGDIVYLLDDSTVLMLELNSHGRDKNYKANAPSRTAKVTNKGDLRPYVEGDDEASAYKGPVKDLVSVVQKMYFDPKYRRQKSAAEGALNSVKPAATPVKKEKDPDAEEV